MDSDNTIPVVIENGSIKYKIPSEEQLENMIEEEEKIRLSKEYIDACTEVKNIPNGWLKVTSKMQEDLVKRYGFDDQISCDVACNYLRRASYIYPDNPNFKKVLYVKNNKASEGKLRVGDYAPNAHLFTLDKDETNLHNLLNMNDKTNIIFGSSAT